MGTVVRLLEARQPLSGPCTRGPRPEGWHCLPLPGPQQTKRRHLFSYTPQTLVLVSPVICAVLRLPLQEILQTQDGHLFSMTYISNKKYIQIVTILKDTNFWQSKGPKKNLYKEIGKLSATL